VYRCELCERWFCEKHLKPRLAFIKDLNVIDKIPEIRALYYTEIQGKEGKGHPDFQYSRKRLEELDIEEKIRFELINKALDGENFSQCPKCGAWHNLYEEVNYCYNCGFELAKTPQTIAVPKPSMKRFSWRRKEETQAKPKKEKTEEVVVGEGPYHFEKRRVRGTHHFRRIHMRLWYWFLLILFIIGMMLFGLSQYYMFVLREYEFGWELSIYSAFIMSVLGAIGLLYLERWWKRHMRRFWGE
jgi:hypothetical protein